MSKEHFEPVTARTIAEIIVSNAYIGYTAGTNKRAVVDSAEGILASHIRKPSDDDWMKSAAFLLQKVITSYDNTKSINTDEIRRFLNKGAVTADMERVEENMGASKSVPQRCEEAYDEAIQLLREWDKNGITTAQNRTNTEAFLSKPNPFKEADIVLDDIDELVSLMKEESKRIQEESKPKLLPFDLKAAQEGAKVVTRDGTPVKIVSDNIDSNYPILYVGNKKNGKQFYNRTDINGIDKEGTLTNSIFILKEPETIEMRIFKHKKYGTIDVLTKDERFMDPTKWELIKTITVTI